MKMEKQVAQFSENNEGVECTKTHASEQREVRRCHPILILC